MTFLKRLISIVLPLAIFVSTFCALIYFVVFSKGYLMNRYSAYGTASMLSMTESDLEAVTDRLVNFVKGREGSIEIKTNVRGDYSDFFNKKDVSHMNDVAGIIASIRSIMIVSAVLATASLCFFILKAGRKSGSEEKEKIKKVIATGIIVSDAIIIFVCIVVVLFATIDLNALVVFCHKIIFDNSDWLLDPRYDNLIFLCPEQLFVDAGKLCGAVFAGLMAVSAVLSVILFPRQSHPRKIHR